MQKISKCEKKSNYSKKSWLVPLSINFYIILNIITIYNITCDIIMLDKFRYQIFQVVCTVCKQMLLDL